MSGTELPGWRRARRHPALVPATRQAWPRTREQVSAASTFLPGHVRSERGVALSHPCRSVSGPPPAGQSEDDPDTGLADHSKEL